MDSDFDVDSSSSNSSGDEAENQRGIKRNSEIEESETNSPKKLKSNEQVKEKVPSSSGNGKNADWENDNVQPSTSGLQKTAHLNLANGGKIFTV